MKAELRPVLVCVFGLLALAGCQEKKQATAAKATAAGEVLPGSVSDAMLPVDAVRSQPPLAPKTEPSASKDDKPRGSGKPVSRSAAEPDSAAEEAPADPPEAPAAE